MDMERINVKTEESKPIPRTVSSSSESEQYSDAERSALQDELRSVKDEQRKQQRALARDPSLGEQSEFMDNLRALGRKTSELMNKLGLASLERFINDPKEPAARLTTSQYVSYAEMNQLAAIGNMSDAALKALRQAEAGKTVTARPTITATPMQPMPRAWETHQISAFMAGTPNLKPLESCQRSEKDPYYKKGGGLNNLCTSVMQQNYVSTDTQWITNLQMLGKEWNHVSPDIYDALNRAVNGYYVGSGPLIGWYKRLKQGKSAPHPKFNLTVKEFEQVYEALPFSMERRVKWDEATLEVMLSKLKRINPRATAGFPRQKAKHEVWKDVVADLYEYYKLIQENKFTEYVLKHPGEFLTQVKNKMDRYEMDDWGEKIRVYYAGNGGKSTLNSMIMQSYSACLLGFWEDPKSCNAHGFSWGHGGAQKLYDWIERHYLNSPAGVYAIGYSDDGLWLIIGPGEVGKREVYIADLDIKHCDMAMGVSFQPIMMQHVVHVLGKLPEGWKNLAKEAVRDIWNQIVILQGPLIYASTNQIHSGMPGTAEADQVGFAVLYVKIRNAFAELLAAASAANKPIGPIEAFEGAYAIVSKTIGLTFKPYSKEQQFKFHKFKPQQVEYPVKFLGKTLKLVNGYYLPYVDLDTTVVQCVHPKKNMKGMAGLRAWQERVRSLAMTSLWCHEAIYESGRKQYELYLSKGVTPASLLDDDDDADSALDVEMVLGPQMFVTFSGSDFPRREWIISLYDERALTTIGKHISVQHIGRKQTVADAFRELYEEKGEESKGAWWADNEQMEAFRSIADVGKGKTAQPSIPETTPEKQGQIPPLPQHIKDAYNKARKEAYDKIRNAFRAPVKLRAKGQMRSLLVGNARDRKQNYFLRDDAGQIANDFDEAFQEEYEKYSEAFDEYDEGAEWEEFDLNSDDDFYKRLEQEYEDNARAAMYGRRKNH